MLTAHALARTRVIIFGVSGVLFFAFAFVAMVTGGIPESERWYTDLGVLPGLIGILVAIISFAGGWAAGDRQAGMAYDESYRADRDKAQRVGFWTGVWAPAVLAILAVIGLIPEGPQVYTVVIFMVAAYFLSFTYFEMKGEA